MEDPRGLVPGVGLQTASTGQPSLVEAEGAIPLVLHAWRQRVALVNLLGVTHRVFHCDPERHIAGPLLAVVRCILPPLPLPYPRVATEPATEQRVQRSLATTG